VLGRNSAGSVDKRRSEDARNLAHTTALPNNSTPKPFKGTVTAANADGTVEVRYTDKSEYTMKLSKLLRATHSLESYMCTAVF
jgi:hypothetical protein